MPNLRTLVLKFGIFGNDVNCSCYETPERSSGVLNFGTSRYMEPLSAPSNGAVPADARALASRSDVDALRGWPAPE